jgi:hypothetical protein
MHTGQIRIILEKVKALDEKTSKLYKLGIDIIELDSATSTLLETIPYLMEIPFDKEKFDMITDDVNWWLYEEVEKIITVEGVANNVEKVEDFLEFLFKHYVKPKQ